MSNAPRDEEHILTHLTEELKSLLTEKTVGTGTDTRMEQKNESDLIGNELLFENLRELERIKARRGVSSHECKDSGVGHPPRN